MSQKFYSLTITKPQHGENERTMLEIDTIDMSQYSKKKKCMSSEAERTHCEKSIKDELYSVHLTTT